MASNAKLTDQIVRRIIWQYSNEIQVASDAHLADHTEKHQLGQYLTNGHVASHANVGSCSRNTASHAGLADHIGQYSHAGHADHIADRVILNLI